MALFEHWTKMKLASRALRAGRFEEAIEIASHPLIREHVRAKAIREKAGRKLLQRAQRHRDRNNLTAAFEDVGRALSEGNHSTSAVELQRDLRAGIGRRRREEELAQEVEREVERLVADARLGEARTRLAALPDVAPVAGLVAEIERRDAAALDALTRAEKALRAADLDRARYEVAQARSLNRDHPRCQSLLQSLRDAEIEELRTNIPDALKHKQIDTAWHCAQQIIARSHEARTDPMVARARSAQAEHLANAAAAALAEGRIDDALARLESYRRTGAPYVADSPASRLARVLQIVRRAQLAERFGEPAVAANLFGDASELVPNVEFCTSERRRLEDETHARRERRAKILAALKRSDREGAISLAKGGADLATDDRFVAALREGIEAFEGGEIIASSRIRRMLHAGDLDGAVRCCVSLFAEPALVPEADSILADIESVRDRVERELTGIERDLVRAESRAAVESASAPLRVLKDLDAGSRAVKECLADLARRASALEHYESGQRCENTRDFDGALAEYRAAADASPTLAVARDAVARVVVPIGERAIRDVLAEMREQRSGEALATAERVLAIDELPTEVRAFLCAKAEELRAEAVGARACLDEARKHYERGELDEAVHALDRADRVFPGHEDAEALRVQIRALRDAEPVIERVEGRLREGRAEDARRELAAIDADALPSHPRIEELRERVDRSRRFDERFVIRVEEGSDYLILTKPRIRIGNIMGKDLDLSILASLSTEHAEIRRSQSFHGGFQYEIEAVPGKECRVNETVVGVHVLEDGDRVRLGEDFEFTFRVPTPRSRAAVLAFADGFEVDGIRHVILMPPDGKKGRILVGPGSDAHVQAMKAEDPIEIFRATDGDHAGDLVGCSRAGVHVDEAGGGAEARLYPGCHVRAGACRLNIEGSA